MGELDYLEIQVPDLLNNPYVINQVVLNNTSYFFEYTWNIRHERVYLSIYYKIANVEFYLIRNVCLLNSLEISKYINDTDWTGKLYFAVNTDSDEVDYRIDNFHTDFHLNYFQRND